MPITHTTVKIAGNKLFAVSDWNTDHTINEIELTDDKKIYFDTAKSVSLRYSTDHGTLVFDDEWFSTEGNFNLYSNTGADGLGAWHPSILLTADGNVTINGNLIADYDLQKAYDSGSNINVSAGDLTFTMQLSGGDVIIRRGLTEQFKVLLSTPLGQSTCQSVHWGPLADATYNLGLANWRWKNLYLSGNLDLDGLAYFKGIGNNYFLGNLGVGTATPAVSAILDLTSTTGALLVPRMTTIQKNALTALNGMILYDTDLNKFQGYENGVWTNLI